MSLQSRNIDFDHTASIPALSDIALPSFATTNRPTLEMLLSTALIALAAGLRHVACRPVPVNAPVIVRLEAGARAPGDQVVFLASKAAQTVNFLKTQVGQEDLVALVEEECAAGDAMWKDTIAHSNPDDPVMVYARALAVVPSDVMNTTVFATWLGTFAMAGYPNRLLQVNPQHYLFRQNGDVRETIEQTGAGPYTYSLAKASIRQPFMPELPQFPTQMFLQATLRDGTPAFYTQSAFRDNEDGNGVEALLALFFPSATPEEMMEPAREHLAIEVTNWLKFAYEDNVSGAWKYIATEA